MTTVVAQSSNSPPQIADVSDLTDLVRTLNTVAGELQSTHASLQAQVAQLKRELAEANAQLRRSQALAALGEMAAGIAHEVRNPLGSIQLNVQMLGKDLQSNPGQAALCAKVSQAVEGIDAIVRDVLSFAREMRLRPEKLSASDLFSRALDACESLILRADVEVHCEHDGAAASLFDGDAPLLTQAIGNVVRNAVEAMMEASSPRKVLRLSAAQDTRRRPDGQRAAHLVLAVEDSGPGIPDAIRDRIFNPFFTTRSTGTGLGLAMVHRIVEAHGGHMTIGTSAFGGARLEMCLPLRASAEEPAAPFIHTNALQSAMLHRQAS